MLILGKMKRPISKIKDALARSEMIILGADCTINYSGRAETFLPRGDRIIMIKPDKTLIVHQPEGNAPVNYMKENSLHELTEEGDKLFLKSKNQMLKKTNTKIWLRWEPSASPRPAPIPKSPSQVRSLCHASVIK